MLKKLLLLLSFGIALCTVANAQLIQKITYNEQPRNADSLEIHEGIMSQHAMKIKYKRNGKKVATITLSDPVMVAMADQEESWGYFQFPNIGVATDGTIIVEWQMQEDSYFSYGQGVSRQYKPQMSKDNGKTWQSLDKSYNIYRRGNNCYLSNGDYIQIKSQRTKDISKYQSFPTEVFKDGDYKYYSIESLPKDLQGVYLLYEERGKGVLTLHASLNDPGLLRYAIDDYMPLVWWGNIRQLADSSLVAGVYPSSYNINGVLNKGGVSFYTSRDKGKSWNITGKILYNPERIVKEKGNGSYDEPCFEVLRDSSFICIMRTGAISPLCMSFSMDKGKHWTAPQAFTPNGVKPQLLKLGNGVLALSSGRPGVQIRFNLDGKGREWTDPIDMIPFMNSDGSFERDISCGYTSLIEATQNTFYLVYSDFTQRNSLDEIRKSIWFRKVTVKRK